MRRATRLGYPLLATLRRVGMRKKTARLTRTHKQLPLSIGLFSATSSYALMQHATCNVLQSQLVSDNGSRSHCFMAKLTGAQQLPHNEQLPRRNKMPPATVAVDACCQLLHVACNARQ